MYIIYQKIMLKQDHILCFISLLITVISISVVSSLLEFIHPTYSGFSYIRPLYLLPIFTGVSFLIWLTILLTQRLLSWTLPTNKKYHLVLGFICGLTPISLIHCLSIKEYTSFFLILCAGVLWAYVHIKDL